MGHFFHGVSSRIILALTQATILMTLVHGRLYVNPKDIRATIKSACGDIIDCVDMYKQFPGLKEQLHRDREVKLNWTRREIFNLISAERNFNAPEQTWRSNNASCPHGTVPIRRTSPAGDRRTAPLFRLYSAAAADAVQDDQQANSTMKEEVAMAYSVAGPYHGAYATVPLWRPRVEPNEYSLSYLLIGGTVDRSYHPIRGKGPPDISYQIAIGLAIWPSYFGDYNPRLFVYYTKDGGKNSSCFNHECGGFVQTSSKHSLGARFRDTSQWGGHNYGVPVGIYRYPGPPIWRVSILGEELGYFKDGTFPMGFFESLHNEMGGRVLNTWPDGRHTMTQMGSGMYPSAGANNVASINFFMAVNNNGGDMLDDPVNTVATYPACYAVADLGSDKAKPGYDVAYGGPGGYYCHQR